MTDNLHPNPYQNLERRIAKWASSFSDIRAIVAYGSRALPDSAFDEFSDLDLVLFSSTPDKYADNSIWLETFAEIWLAVLEITGAGDPEWFVLYSGGLKVDIILSLVESDSELTHILDESPYRKVLARGIRVIYPASVLSPSKSISPPELTGPWRVSETGLERCVTLSLMRTVKAAMYLSRGELSRSHTVLNCDVRLQLQALMEMHARVTRDADVDTWYKGRFMERWADPDALAAIDMTYSNFDSDAVRKALLVSTELIPRLATEISDVRGYRLPHIGQKRTVTWLYQVLGGVDDG